MQRVIRRARLSGLGLLAVVSGTLALAAPAASGAIRHAEPDGDGPEPCLQSDPCDVYAAADAGFGGVQDGDEVRLAAGTYDLTGESLAVSNAITIRPAPGAGRPHLTSVGSRPVELYAPATLRGLRVSGADIPCCGSAVDVVYASGGGLLDRMVVVGGGSTLYALDVGGGLTVRNSAVYTDAPSGLALNGSTGGGRVVGVTAISDPIVPTNSAGLGANSCFGAQEIEVVNSIVRGAEYDLVLAESCAGNDISVEISHSNYETAEVVGSGPVLVEGEDNQAVEPMLADPAAGDFRQLPASATVDAGLTGAAEGPLELLGDARIQGDGVDIGAHELDTAVEGARLVGKRRQRQKLPKVKARVRASAAEAVALLGRGSIRARGKAYKLKPVRRTAAADRRKALVLKPKRKAQQGKVVAALRDGARVVARVEVRFTDDAGNEARLGRTVRFR